MLIGKSLLLLVGVVSISQSVQGSEFTNVTVTAKRQFAANPFIDGTYVPVTPTIAKIPKEIVVSSGDAGFGQALLSIDDIQCVYQADGWKKSRSTNTGTFYQFVSCKRRPSGLLAFLANLFSRKFIVGQELVLNKSIVLRIVSGRGPEPITASAVVPVKQNAPAKILIVETPADGSALPNASFTIAGKIAGGQPIASLALTLNEVFKIKINDDRSFSYDFLASDGTNSYRLSLRDGGVVVAEEILTLTYIPPYPGVQKITATSEATVSYVGIDAAYSGTSMRFPIGAVAKDIYAFIFPSEPQGEEDREFPSVPSKYRQVGPAPVFQPLMKSFLKPVTFVVPFRAEILPPGKTSADVKLLLLGDDGWMEASGAALVGNTLEYQASRTHFWAATTAVIDVQNAGEVVISVERVGAKIYLDNADMRQLAPSTLSDVPPGPHTLRLSKIGFNDLYLPFVQAADHGSYLEGHLTQLAPGGPGVVLSSSIPALVTTGAATYIITGVVTGASSPELYVQGLVSTNGDERSVQVNADGTFETSIPLWRSETTVDFRMTDTRSGKTTISRQVVFTKPLIFSALKTSSFSEPMVFDSQNSSGGMAVPIERISEPEFIEEEEFLKISSRKRARSSNSGTLSLGSTRPTTRSNDEYVIEHSWSPHSSRRTDMYLRDEYGAVVSRHAGGVYFPGAWYYHGYTPGGPDRIVLTNPPPGKYTLTSFAANDPGTFFLSEFKVYKNGKLVFNESKLQASMDSWLAYTFEVRTVKVAGTTLTRSADGELSAQKSPCRIFPGYECDAFIFTTLEGENEIGITASATSNIDPTTIQYRVREVGQYIPNAPKPIIDVPVTGSGASVTFKAINTPLVARTDPPFSTPLVYEVVAYVPGMTESDPYYIVQDIGSQVRQEFIDQNGIITQAIVVPAQGTVNLDSNSELAAFSDFSERNVLIEGKAAAIRDIVKNAFTTPIVVTSGWRNPRRNSRVNGEYNSIHQYGSAVDFIPAQLQESWDSINLKETLEMIKQTVDPAINAIGCTSRVHDAGSGDHLHVQCK
jgi:hypothetical protein